MMAVVMVAVMAAVTMVVVPSNYIAHFVPIKMDNDCERLEGTQKRLCSELLRGMHENRFLINLSFHFAN